MSLFHERLKELKDSCGKTQMSIAADLKISSQAFSYYINGREPNYDLLIKIANYFDCTTDYLLGKSNYKNEDEKATLGEISNEFIGKICMFSNGKEALQNLLELMDLADSRDAEVCVTSYFECGIALNFVLQNIYRLADEFTETHSFDLTKYLNYCMLIDSVSRLSRKNIKQITYSPLPWFITLATAFGDTDDADFVKKQLIVYPKEVDQDITLERLINDFNNS